MIRLVVKRETVKDTQQDCNTLNDNANTYENENSKEYGELNQQTKSIQVKREIQDFIVNFGGRYRSDLKKYYANNPNASIEDMNIEFKRLAKTC